MMKFITTIIDLINISTIIATITIIIIANIGTVIIFKNLIADLIAIMTSLIFVFYQVYFLSEVLLMIFSNNKDKIYVLVYL